MTWKVDNIGAVFFPSPGTTVGDALSLWTELGIGSPDSFQRPPGGLAGASSLAIGVTGNVRIGINSQIGRIDVTWVSATLSVDEPPFLTDWKSVVKEAEKASKKLLNGIDAVRIGVTINASQRLANGEDIVAELGKLDLNATFPTGSEDIIHQFNVPALFNVNGARMNRIHTWTTGQQQMISFNLNVGQPAATPFVVHKVPVITFRVDANCVNLANEEIKYNGPKMLGELFGEAEANITKYCLSLD